MACSFVEHESSVAPSPPPSVSCVVGRGAQGSRAWKLAAVSKEMLCRPLGRFELLVTEAPGSQCAWWVRLQVHFAEDCIGPAVAEKVAVLRPGEVRIAFQQSSNAVGAAQQAEPGHMTSSPNSWCFS